MPVARTRIFTSLMPISGSGTSSSQRPRSARLFTSAFTGSLSGVRREGIPLSLEPPYLILLPPDGRAGATRAASAFDLDGGEGLQYRMIAAGLWPIGVSHGATDRGG